MSLINAGELLPRALARIGDTIARIKNPPAADLPIDAGDVQGLVFRGYGQLHACCYPLLAVRDAARARAFLGTLWPKIAPGVPGAQHSAVQIAFTHAGLAALGLMDEALSGFAAEFIGGMVNEHRSRFLGDSGDSAPEYWQWGGPSTPQVHAALLVFAQDEAQLAPLLAELRAGFASGFQELRTLHTTHLGGVEHFGFADGISQPAIHGYHASESNLHRIKAGEFILGYPNEYGLFTGRPMLQAKHDPMARLPLDVEGTPRHDFGKNGTYLVFRQLRQHVGAFRAALDTLTQNADGVRNPQARERLAAQMVGRWPSGASLIEAPHGDDVSKTSANEFRYQQDDPDGLKCPIGAHVRRANPRDALDPEPGSERSLSVNRRHRLIRRGRSYGPALAQGESDDAERGLMFIAVNANIIRQFEFIQHSWIADPRFNGFSNAADPIAGAAVDNEFAAPGDPIRKRCTGLPRFVTVAGGAYFFMPGVRALRFLAEIQP